MHQILPCLWHVINWYYSLMREEKQWREKSDMKKPSVVTLSIKSYYKSSSTAVVQGTLQCCFLSNVSIRLLGNCRFQLYVEFF